MPRSSVLSVLLVLAACGKESEKHPVADGNDPSLARFTSCEDLRGYVTEATVEALVQSRYGWYGWDYAEDGTNGGDGEGGDSPDEWSETNIQEEGVDEPDLVKTNGEYLFIAQDDELTVVDSWPPEETSKVASLPLDGWTQDLFLYGDKLLIYSNVYDDEDYYRSSWSRMSVVDVSDPTAPEVVREVDLEGWFVDARRIDGDVYTVVSSYLELPYEIWELAWSDEVGLRDIDYDAPDFVRDSAIADARTKLYPLVKARVDEMAISELLPLMRDGLAGEEPDAAPLLACTDVYRPEHLSWPSTLTVAHLDLGVGDAGGDVSGTGLMSDGWTVYASPENLYIAQSSWYWWWGYGDLDLTTHLHKFSLDGADSVYEGSGAVPGWVLNQFSMSEYEGDLRVATTDIDWWWGWGDTLSTVDDPANNVFVLRPDEQALSVIGELRGIAPGERIYAARFVGDVGYLVTFEQIDPLFTMDLSDPTEPKLLGELEVTGYSAYLHPIDGGYLLAVGMEADESGWTTGLAISLFDVNDLGDPTLADRWVLTSDDWSYSEALWDHHAFTFYRDVLALPIYTYDYDGSTGDWSGFSGLLVLQVDADAPEGSKLVELGRIDHEDLVAASKCLYEDWGGCDDYYWYATMRRGVMIEDSLYSISSYGVKVNELLDPDTEQASVVFWPAAE